MLTTIEIRGGVTGTLFLPPVTGWRQVRRRFTLRQDPADPRAPRVESVREALEQVAGDDADFQTAGRLTADTAIIIRRHRPGRRVTERTLYVDEFPRALSELVDFDVFSYDEEE